jgi:hypothetical protein
MQNDDLLAALHLAALHAIADMRITQETDTVQLAALCIAVAKTAIAVHAERVA